MTLEFFFDCSSPWTYLGFETVQNVAAECGAEITWKPILVGGVFNAVNRQIYTNREDPEAPKMQHMHKDLTDWARHQNLDIRFPPSVFPVNSVKVMRGCIVCQEEGKLVPYARAAFRSYWGEDKDISQDLVVRQICAEVGLDADDHLARIAEPAVKDQLRANTEELIERGGFGTPTIFVGGSDMYFGNDRMPFVKAALQAG
jgi:2-hydroxychromene-2-carboxylate isomerase